MDIEMMRTTLATHIAEKDYITIQKQGETWRSQCIPLCMGETLLMSLSFRDFFPDGYEIVALNQVAEMIHSETDVYFGEIVKKEGADGLMDDAPKIDLTDWPSVFRFFMKTKEIISIEVEHECMDLGRIKAVFADGIEIRRFDATGVWERENCHVSYGSITKVGVKSHYIKTFEKYLPPENSVNTRGRPFCLDET